MTRARRIAIQGLIAGVLGGHLVCLVMGRQIWPFSHYPMFAESHAGSSVIRATVLTGETDDGTEFWFDEQGYLGRSLSPFFFSPAFGPEARSRGGPGEIRRRLQQVAYYHERLRQRGATAGPRLRALRLYDAEWTADSSLSNRGSPRMTLIESHIPALGEPER